MLKCILSHIPLAASETAPPLWEEHNNLRKEPIQERSLAAIVAVIVFIILCEFFTVSFPFPFYEEIYFHETALIIVLSFLLGLAAYHILILIYDRGGAVYFVFIFQILTSCLYLFTLGEIGNRQLIPVSVLSSTALSVIAAITLCVTLSLTFLFSYMMLKNRIGDHSGKLYIASLLIGIALFILFSLPIPFLKQLFVPQVVPISLVIITQCLMVEAYDEHFLANSYIAVYQKQQELEAKNKVLEIINLQRQDMMATISHETRTPLAVISNYAALIAAEMRAEGVNEQRARDLDNITEQIQNIAAIMSQYSDFSKKTTFPDPEPVSAEEVIQRTSFVYRHILESAGITLHIQISHSLRPVSIPPGSLTQILLNLMKNTAKHSHAKHMWITAKMVDPTTVAVTVSDDGNGVDPTILPNLFERGVTDSENGAGIGLSVCKEIVEEAGGNISMENGEGLTVTFTLPVFKEVNAFDKE
jgi:signal transduction histidine kinase